MSIKLHLAKLDDMRQIYQWRNDPFLLKLSSSQLAVGWKEHKAWFKDALKDQGKKIYIICEDEKKIGLIRFDRINLEKCVISVYLLEPHTRKGLGVLAIKLGCNLIKLEWAVVDILAFVRADNLAGGSGFRKCGFIEKANYQDCPKGHTTWCLRVNSPALDNVFESSTQAWLKDDAQNNAYYSNLIDSYGIDSRSLNWGSSTSQFLRFRILAEVAPLNGCSLLDVGCGLGDLYSWLKSHGKSVDYTGIDISPDMISLALKRFPLNKFEIANLLDEENTSRQSKIVIASGIFAKRSQNPVEFMCAMIKAMFSIATVALAFNSLSIHARDKESGEFYADPAEIIAFCRKLTPWVVLREDYHSRDFTIYMYKNRTV